MVECLLCDLEMEKYLKKIDPSHFNERWESIQEFSRSAAQLGYEEKEEEEEEEGIDTLVMFLEKHRSPQGPEPPKKEPSDGVVITTLHTSKGLECLFLIF